MKPEPKTVNWRKLYEKESQNCVRLRVILHDWRQWWAAEAAAETGNSIYQKTVQALQNPHHPMKTKSEPKQLNPAQLDGRACVVCGSDQHALLPLHLPTSTSTMVFRCNRSECDVSEIEVQAWIFASEQTSNQNFGVGDEDKTRNTKLAIMRAESDLLKAQRAVSSAEVDLKVARHVLQQLETESIASK